MASTNSVASTPIFKSRFSKEALSAMHWTGVVLSLGFIIFRVYVRVHIFRRLFPDDGFVIAAWILYVVLGIIYTTQFHAMWVTSNGGSGWLSQLPPDYMQQVHVFLRIEIATYVLGFTVLWLVKFSFLLFFRKLGNHMRAQRILWWLVLGFTCVSYMICVSLGDYKCWGSADEIALLHCTSLPLVYRRVVLPVRITTFLDIVTDALIIVVSWNILWKVQINFRKKLVLTGICSLTVFIMCASVIRVVLGSKHGRLDLTWYLFWGGVEYAVAIIVSCLASFRTLYTHIERSKSSSNYSDLNPMESGDSATFSGHWPKRP